MRTMPCRSIQHVLILVSLCGCASTEEAANSGQATNSAGAAPAAAGSSMSATAGMAAPSAAVDDGTSFEVSVQPFINKACNCHQSNPLMAPFSLKQGEAYKAIVNVPSGQVKTMMLVKPGSTAESYLWHKVNGTFMDVGGTGMIMPFTIPLNAEEKKIFENWILGGAKP
jgi:hypothetical protein